MRRTKREINYDKRDESVGPTPDRLLKSSGDYVVGDDQQGTRIYQFQDSPLARLYKRLAMADKSDDGRRQLTAEHVALMRYRNHWYCAGLEASVGTIDLDRVHSSDPANMSGMAKTERQFYHRQMYRNALAIVGHSEGILLDNFVCYEHDRHIASGMSSFRFKKTLRKAAAKLAKEWGTA